MEVKYRGEKVDVVYETWGFYRPATQYDPPEYPEYEIIQVFYDGADILPILNEDDLAELYEELYSLLI